MIGGPSAAQRLRLVARTPEDIRRRLLSPRRRLRRWTSRISGSSPLLSASAIRSASVRRTSSCSALPSIGWKPGHDPGLRRKGREQRLGEAVDRLDLQPAGAVEHSCEQLPRTLAAPWDHWVLQGASRSVPSSLSFSRTQAASRVADAVGHLGRGRLGEREAEDRFGTRALEQQPKHARGQHLRLAGSRRSRERCVNGWIGR